MIRVTYHAPYELTVQGHAGERSPTGISLVCAATTALVGGLCEALAQNESNFRKRELVLREGYSHIKVEPDLAFANACEKMFEPCIYGLAHLSSQYPEYIQMTML